MTTFVLVPGVFHGGWWFEPLARELRAQGHEAYAVSLTGLGDRVHLASAGVNLDTHVADVVSVLESNDLSDVVLVGHSSGGMSITGAADAVPHRISGLVYLDAFVPRDGDSVWSMSPPFWRDQYLSDVAEDGFSMQPPKFLTETRVTAQPLASMLQAIRLTGTLDQIPRKHYLFMTGYPETPFTRFYDRLLRDPSWTVHTLPHGHNVMAEAFDEVLKLVLSAAS
ncbi:alpha/beta fold hydrolase [Nocardia huaxiensis]|uniref:Alpha/beta fold hydrolase n=1 Tax=Nocardia huaxiensis TaxID=2755382 RepID=A0A7D6V951_9NOCA|nr:alpha/beta fold hydrolase [Nocardia huaxiensis]QLY29794.1 alpha/beta fold hydrolase [Nocardia huaxiensis]UFS96617.1 alpha/beta hydrolase [Nocardia huaxiensis]